MASNTTPAEGSRFAGTDADDSAPVRNHPYHHSDISADLSAPAPAMLTNKANGANTGQQS